MTYRAKVVARMGTPSGKLLLLVETKKGKQAIPLKDKLQSDFFPDGCTIRVRTRGGNGCTIERLNDG